MSNRGQGARSGGAASAAPCCARRHGGAQAGLSSLRVVAVVDLGVGGMDVLAEVEAAPICLTT
jgi:hypothetical protein